MKPANIMMVPTDGKAPLGFRAAITDFGLARLDPLVSSGDLTTLSQTSRPIGTLAYMAPEQLDGKPVSPATDIYALGLILFEMVTGTRAFPSDNFLSGIARRLTGPPPNPQSLAPGLPTPWCHAIEGCLRLKPADRFQSAANVIDVLNGSNLNLPRVGKSALVRRLTLATWPFRHRLFALVAVFLAVVALFLGIPRLYKLEPDSKVDPGALVYLAPVKNETGEKAFDNLTELIQAGLTQSVQINLLDQGRVGDTLQTMLKGPDTVIDPPIAREIAMRTGAVRVIFATVSGSAGKRSLDVEIEQPDASSPTRVRGRWKQSFGWNSPGSTASSSAIPQELLSAVRTSSDWIRQEVGESRNDIARLDAPPEDATTSSWEALADYSFAENLAAQYKRHEARDALRSAIQLDPGFALAYARLGDILVNLNHVDEGYHAYLTALEQSDKNRLSLRERDRIKGIYAQDTEDFQALEAAFREYSLYYDHDYLGWFYRARPLSMLGRTRDAIEMLKQAHTIAPDKTSVISSLVMQTLVIGDLPQSHKWADQLHDMHDDVWAWYADGTIDFAEGSLDSAAASFEKIAHSSDPLKRKQGFRYLADLSAEQGNAPACWIALM
jgi:tetratricopeptide (TPR) repeat protein